MGPAPVGVVEDPLPSRDLLLVEHREHRVRHRPEVHRNVLRLHHQLARGVDSAVEQSWRSLMFAECAALHGGGFVSGSKDHISNYLKILAGKGYTVVGVDYSLAPRKTYPTPLRQVNAALAHLVKHAQALHVDASCIVLAGDSVGAQISAQIANIITSPAYANAVGIVPAIEPSQLAAVILYCGPYDLGAFKVDGALGWFMSTVLWSYSGSRDYATKQGFALASILHYVTPKFPPTFISAGNGDPLLPHSVAMADALAKEGVRVDRLFFAQEHTPTLPHEYQFNLDTDAGQLALARSLGFLSSIFPRR